MKRDRLEARIARQFDQLRPGMDERMRRLYAASESFKVGRGGVRIVANATGMAPSTICAGRRELREREAALARGETVEESSRVRRRGAGRPRLTESQPGLLEALRKLVDPYERGDPERPLRWVAKSLRQLAKALREQGYTISHTKVGELLVESGFSLQANRKTKEGRNHPERNAQFETINARTVEMQAAGNPVISVDTKKKELVGEFKNGGREWRPKGDPEDVNVHDFPSMGGADPPWRT